MKQKPYIIVPPAGGHYEEGFNAFDSKDKAIERAHVLSTLTQQRLVIQSPGDPSKGRIGVEPNGETTENPAW